VVQDKLKGIGREEGLIGGTQVAHDLTGENTVYKDNPLVHVAFEPGAVEKEVLCGAVRALLLKQGRWQPVVHTLMQQLYRCGAVVWLPYTSAVCWQK
jgi:hypothetical protein